MVIKEPCLYSTRGRRSHIYVETVITDFFVRPIISWRAAENSLYFFLVHAHMDLLPGFFPDINEVQLLARGSN